MACVIEVFGAIESSEKITIDKVPQTIKLELPNPSRGYIDYSKWACDNANITLSTMTGCAYATISSKFKGSAKVECVYVAKWYDSKGFTQADTYMRTFYISYTPGATEDLKVEISPAGGCVKRGTKVKISCNNEKAKIYYTENGDTPSENSYKWLPDWPIIIEDEVTIKAIAILNGSQHSEVVSAYFTIDESDIIRFTTVEGVEVTARKYDKNSLIIGEGNLPCIDENYSGKITIPENVDGYSISRINTGAFTYCDLTELYLPEGLKSIYTEACEISDLRKLWLPSSISSIGSYAFYLTFLDCVYCKSTDPQNIDL